MEQVGIIGAGVMGAGIARVFANAGYRVCLIDQTSAYAQAGKRRIEEELDKAVIKGKLDARHKDEMLERIDPSEDMACCAGSVLCIEAVVEKAAQKQDVFHALEGIVDAQTLLVSNTSSISITEIASVLKHKERFLGMHFFNPAPYMRLVELIRGERTSDASLARAEQIVKTLKKESIRVEESAGFVVNRILIPMVNEAVGVLAEGVASAEEIDLAMKLGANHPMGPLALGDLIGLDVVLEIMKILQAETGDPKYRPHPVLHKMVRAGKMGKKTGEGFYCYE